jgi:formylmethanofuran dehydrogenase subunit D
MGLSTSRVTDIGVGICCCHPGCIGTVGALITGSTLVEKESMASSRITDIVLHACGHVGVMVTGSSLVEDENFSTSRITDAYVGCVCGVLVTGAGTVEDE